jgi:hypothetical protein
MIFDTFHGYRWLYNDCRWLYIASLSVGLGAAIALAFPLPSRSRERLQPA